MLGTRKLALVVLAGLMLPLLGLSAWTAESEINSLKVIPWDDGRIRLEIGKAGEVEFDAFTMSEPDRLVIDCVGAIYDLSSIEKNVENHLIYSVRTSQYRVDPVRVSRIVVDLKKKVDYRIWEEGNIQIVELTERKTGHAGAVEESPGKQDVVPFPVLPQVDAAEDVEWSEGAAGRMDEQTSAAAMGPILPLIVPAKPATAGSPEKASSNVDQKVEKSPAGKIESPWIEDKKPVTGRAAEADPQERLSPAVKKVTSGPQYTTGADEQLPWIETYARGNPAAGGGFGMGSRRITLDAQGADIKTVLRTISDFAGINIVAGSDVKGDVYVHIKDAPWEEALDILLKAHGYGYREEYGMIRVAEMKQLMKEELDQQTAERKKEELLPLVTRIIFIHNSNADELREAMTNVVSTRGQIDVDLGSNALIINDIEKNIEKIEEMVRTLDKKNYQVDINAKLVEVDVEATRELGINWGLLNIHKSGFNGVGSAEVTEGLSLSSAKLKFGTVRSWGELNSVLEMLEKSNKANIISNPRITTMDNREATILVGKEIPLIVADEAGNPITELTKIGIMMRVIPHVNADHTITLDLHPEVSELQSESTAQGGVIISTSEADTRVIVQDGETAVIGGLIKKVTTDVVRGVPFLKDIPGLGRLFSSVTKADKKQELVIFVTPTIVE